MKERTIDGCTLVVDDHNEWMLHAFNWGIIRSSRTFYARCHTPFGALLLHHLVAGFPIRGHVTDHKDGNGGNNTDDNLRTVTKRQNCQNQHQDKKFPFPGVAEQMISGNFRAHITIDGKTRNLGTYRTPEAAFLVYRAFSKSIGHELLDYAHLDDKDIRKCVRQLLGIA